MGGVSYGQRVIRITQGFWRVSVVFQVVVVTQ